MERIVKIHIERLPEGVYLATSEEIQGLVAQGHPVSETLEIARDVARKLLETQETQKGGVEMNDPAASSGVSNDTQTSVLDAPRGGELTPERLDPVICRREP